MAIDQRPKVKKHAQDVVENILMNNSETKANLVTQEFINQQLNKYKKVSNVKQHTSPIMSLLGLIDCTVEYWDQAQLINLGEILVQLPKLSVNFITDKTYYILDKIFKTLTVENDNLLPKLMDRLVNAKPNSNDITNMAGWLSAIQNGFIKLLQSHPNSFFTLFYQCFEQFFKNELQGDYDSTNLKIGKCLSEIIDHFDTTLNGAEPNGIQQIQSLENMFKLCVDGLDYKFRFSFPSVLMIATSLTYQFGYDHPEWLIPLIQLLDQVRPMFQYKPELDLCLGASISILGASRFLSVLPLNLDSASSSQIGRAWLLPLMKEHVQNTELNYFINDILNGTMSKLQQKKEQFQQQERDIEVKIYQTLIDQLWALFPGFCSYPIDLTSSFSNQFAEQIAQLIYSNPELRPFLFTGLSNLIDTNQEFLDSKLTPKELQEKTNEYHIDVNEAKANLEHLAKMSTNFLMVLFNVFTTVLPQHRAPLLKVLHSFLSITSVEDVNGAFDKVIQMLEQEAQNPNPTQPTQAGPTMPMMMMDLSSLMVPYLSQQNSSSLLQACKFFIQSPNDIGLHKKSYKLLVRLATCENTQPIVLAQLAEFDTMLLSTSTSTPQSAKRARLELLSLIFANLSSDRLHLIPALLPEVILATKETNDKARIAAFNLLIKMAHRMKEGGSINLSKLTGDESDSQASEANLEEFIKMTLAGLTGSTPHMLSATVSCISRLFFEFMKELPIELIQDIFEAITSFEDTQNREIIKPTIGLIKILCISFDKDNLESYLGQILSLLLKWSHNHKSQFRVRVRHIIERLVRKFGFEKLEPLFPEEHIKMLNNIKKRKLRAKRRAGQQQDEDHEHDGEPTAQQLRSTMANAYEQALYGSDSEDSEAEEQVAGTKRKIAEPSSAKGRANYLKADHDDDDVVDFLDRSAISKISNFKPKSRQARIDAKKLSNPFATDASGKLVIEDEDAPVQGKRKDADAMDVDEEQNEAEDYYKEHLESKEGFDRINNRIKFRKAKPGQSNDDFKDDDDDAIDTGKSNKFRKSQTKGGSTVKIGQDYKAKVN